MSLFINPIDIEHILSTVLQYVRHKDLLQCRLVNHTWNQQTITELRRRNQTLSFDCTNRSLQKYLELLKTNPADSDHFGLNQFAINVGDFKTCKNSEACRRTITRTIELVQKFGQHSVKEFSFTSEWRHIVTDFDNVLILLNIIAPGLQRLTLNEHHRSYESANCDKELLLNTVFPSLRRLTYFSVDNNPQLLAQIVNSAPNLRSLKISVKHVGIASDTSHEVGSARFTLALNGIQIPRVSGLRELTVSLSDENTYEALARLTLPNLTTLSVLVLIKLSYKSSVHFAQFLEHNCPNLTGLFLSFVADPNPIIHFPNPVFFNLDDALEIPTSLPVLSNLTHFGYQMERLEFWCRDKPDFVRLDGFSSNTFPNLTSITATLGTFLYLSSRFQAPFYNPLRPVPWYNSQRLINNIQMPTVSTLVLNMNNLWEFNTLHLPAPKISPTEGMNQLHLLYPNIRKVVLNNQIRPTINCPGFKPVLAALLKEMPGIEELEITNYYKDALNEIIKAVPHLLQNLRKFRIPSLEKQFLDMMKTQGRGGIVGIGTCGTKSVTSVKPTLDLAYFLGHLPSLVRLDVGDEFLLNYFNVERLEDVQVKLEELKNPYPLVTINLI